MAILQVHRLVALRYALELSLEALVSSPIPNPVVRLYRGHQQAASDRYNFCFFFSRLFEYIATLANPHMSSKLLEFACLIELLIRWTGFQVGTMAVLQRLRVARKRVLPQQKTVQCLWQERTLAPDDKVLG